MLRFPGDGDGGVADGGSDGEGDGGVEAEGLVNDCVENGKRFDVC